MNPELTDTFGNYLVHGIEEIHLPDTVSYWPVAPGWKILGLLLLLYILYWSIRKVINWWNNRYRWEAIRQLKELMENNWQTTLPQLPFLLKATALFAYPRDQVAQLSGEPWLKFLDKNYTGPSFCEEVGKSLLAISYQPQEKWDITEEQAIELIKMTELWIRTHNV